EVSKGTQEGRYKETSTREHRNIPQTKAEELAALNMEVKQSMAEELAAMGLGEESINRILGLKTAQNNSERSRAKSKRGMRM
ncbi:MAG: hypothetical protein DRH12_18615, partial [Deltaproteobacteria bacterium]